MSYFKPNIDAMAPYVPGAQVDAKSRVIKLNTNENAYPPSGQVAKALANFDTSPLRRYCDPMASNFAEIAAKINDVPAGWILPGNGSDDLIVMISRACLGPGKRAVWPGPTFGFYFTQAIIESAECVEVPFGDNFALPTDDLIAADGAVTFVANPNSPSGTAATNDELARLAENLTGLLVIDEAYCDFAGTTAIKLAETYDNVIVLRTLSKGYALAGLRLGYAIANPGLIAGLVKTKAIYNVNSISAALGAAALADQDYKNETAAKIIASRQELSRSLKELGFSVLDSKANFLLAGVPGGKAKQLADDLKARSILVRYFEHPRICTSLRITVGTENEIEELIDALRELS